MRIWLVSLGILVSVLAAVALCWRVNLREAGEHIGNVGWGTWLIAVGIYLAAFLPRGLRWTLMLPNSERLPFAWVTRIVVIGYAANNLLPFRLGEVVRSYLIAERFKLSKLTCLATIGAEKILDGCCLLGLLAVCLPFIHVQGESRVAFERMFLLASSLFGVALLACIALAACNQQLHAVSEKLSSPIVRRLIRAASEALAIFRDARVFVGAASLTLVIWLMEAACFVFFSSSIGIPNPVPAGLFCLVIVNLSILVPSAPGYVGVFQAGAVAAFTALSVTASAGLAVGAVTHAAQYIPTTLLGIAFASAMGLNWRRLYRLKDE
jgi:glycosyltransferase 2 family protein